MHNGRDMGKSQELYTKAKTIIPGGTQLLSKRPEMFLPNLWPSYYKKAKGCEVIDLDDKSYIDMSYMGIGANVLGYADNEVNEAVINSVHNGNMCTLNAPEEVSLAEQLIEMHPWADMVRYAKSGGECATISIRIARSLTNKDIVLFCGYHGWHDWYLASNLGDESTLEGHLLPGLSPSGVPKGLRGTSIPFAYNDLKTFSELIKKYKGKIAAVIMEPVRNILPDKGFLENIRSITKKENIVLIYDEISAGFRICPGGVHLTLGVEPDIALFGKALSNGYPLAAVIGRREVMEAAQNSFISSTYWTERTGSAAALATIKKYTENDVHLYLKKSGKKIQKIWKDAANMNNLKVKVSGIEPLSYFAFDYENSLELKTIFIQEMLKQGFLATTGFYASFAHKENYIMKYGDAVNVTFTKISKGLSDGSISTLRENEICHSGFKRLT